MVGVIAVDSTAKVTACAKARYAGDIAATAAYSCTVAAAACRNIAAVDGYIAIARTKGAARVCAAAADANTRTMAATDCIYSAAVDNNSAIECSYCCAVRIKRPIRTNARSATRTAGYILNSRTNYTYKSALMPKAEKIRFWSLVNGETILSFLM